MTVVDGERRGRRWRTAEADPASVGALARALDLPRPLATVLVARGFSDPAVAETFLSPRLGDVRDPFGLPGMDAAVNRIWCAIDAGEPMTVFGDYDADGVTGTALLTSVLRALGGHVSSFLPERERDGYGLTPGAVRRCLDTHAPRLVVTVDCGTCCVDGAAEVAKAGVDLVVTDHHEISGPLANARAVVNPMCDALQESPLAGVGVAFKLCHALVKRGRVAGRPAAEGVDLRQWLELVAIGTIADVVPLTGENRILVKHGLLRLSRTAAPGLKALKRVARIEGALTGQHVGYMLGPRLNAAGRMGSAQLALDLLLAHDAEPAMKAARQLDDVNRERRDVEDAIRAAAEAEIDGYFKEDRHFGLVVSSPDWHIGTVGIVASRLCARYMRPTIVAVHAPDGSCRGSCRGVEALDLVEALGECAAELSAFGGHRMAAGVTIKPGRLEAFRECFNQVCAERLAGRDLQPAVVVEAWLDHLGEADAALLEALGRLRPFGAGNPTPLWGIRGVRVLGLPRRVGGGKHLKLTVAAGADQVDCIGFGMGDRTVPDGAIDVAFELQADDYRGTGCVQLCMKDFRESE